MMRRCRSLLIFCVHLFLAACVSAIYSPSSLQTGPDLSGSTFPASVVYDTTSHSIVVVGSTFGRTFEGGSDVDVPRQDTNCFLTTIRLPTERDRIMRFDTMKSYGLEGVPEACLTAIYHERNSKLIVAGHSEPNGFMEDLYDGSQLLQAVQYGTLLEIDVNPTDNHESYHLVGGRVLQEARAIYPVAMATATADEWIYLATQYTDSTQRNSDGTTTDSPTIFDVSEEADPTRWFEYGSKFRMRVNRFRRINVMEGTGLKQTITVGWERAFATSDDQSIHVSGIVEIGDLVLIVGSTSGYGPDFGGNEAPIGTGDLDGYITKLNKETGMAVELSGTGQRSTHRIQSIDGADDWIAGLCHDPADPNHIYIVGATGGNLDRPTSASYAFVDAYLMKIQVASLEAVWTYQVGAQAKGTGTDIVQVRGISCAVSPDGKSVWMGGVVQDDAVLSNSGVTESFGGDDVFVAKLLAEDGELAFIRQLGSDQDDGLAMRGGLVIDKDLDCVLVGYTYGSLYRTRGTNELEDQPWISDMFATMINGNDGEITSPVGSPGGFTGSNGSTPPSKPTIESPRSPNSEVTTDETKGKARTGLIIMIFVLVGSLTAALLFARRGSNVINGDVVTDRSEVIHYLNAFEVDDIDLKHSATGGWHCSYSNDLANGINRRSSRSYDNSLLRPSSGGDPLLTKPLTHSRIVKDSLFMDEGLERNHLVGFSEPRSSSREGYDGLIDAYNADFNERRSSSSLGGWAKEFL